MINVLSGNMNYCPKITLKFGEDPMPFKMNDFIFGSGVSNTGMGDLSNGLVTLFGLPKEMALSLSVLRCDGH
jgi:hypothetical protein